MYLRLKAPFATFRPFQSGAYRSTTPVPSLSTVYGLLLNLAGIEQRAPFTAPVTLIREDLPAMAVAIGIPEGAAPKTAMLSQQLHQYLVGSSDKELSQKTHGAKPWIAPVRREVLVDLDLVVGIQAEQWLCDRIIAGLNGELDEPRYGLPFAGDNNFLFDSIELISSPPMARWYSPLQNSTRPSRGVCRLTTWIDRADNSKTQTAVFAPSNFVLNPPESAWVNLPSQAN
ncbi:MAG: type I-MYXAN CRISPR-associated protein Cas5/Cmx5/DevS [Kastovskya adunca ATA6-11-RM4]|nr:type I-MYXAN CRISPR-associated protein Cas5/Cmx5/DevS [Kastovskya adunca ATA6-11-RM4]